MEVTIVPMRQEHTAQIAALEAACFSDPWPESILQQELENPLSLWLCAMDGDTVAGYVGSQTVLGEADMMNLAVSPAYRRQGVAGTLISALTARAEELGLAFVTSHPGMEWPGKAYRRLRLDAMAQPENRARVRFESRMARLLRQEAVAALGEAKEAHDALEALYHPYVDFDGVRTLAALETARLLAWQSSMR